MGTYSNKAQKTKKYLIDITMNLLTKESWSEISVNDIARSANVNRSTFYRYFLDKNDLIRQVESAILNKLTLEHQQVLKKIDGSITTAFNDDSYIKAAVAIIDDNHQLLSVLLSSQANTGFDDRLEEKLREMIVSSIRNLNPNTMNKKSKIISHYYAAGFVGLIKLWLVDSQYSRKEILHFIQKSTREGAFATL
ncbi:hypothetical protein ACZ99_14215 [Lactobacillus sp. ATCC 15578]|nr:hypothetical protein ACZ99_14215 [Lactobacillus sp. ATCC 15578]